MSDIERKRSFVLALAQFIAGDAAKKSILLDPSMPRSLATSLAEEWAALRATTPVFGWTTVEEAEKTLGEWLGVQL